jgi:hypothetical protein
MTTDIGLVRTAVAARSTRAPRPIRPVRFWSIELVSNGSFLEKGTQ